MLALSPVVGRELPELLGFAILAFVFTPISKFNFYEWYSLCELGIQRYLVVERMWAGGVNLCLNPSTLGTLVLSYLTTRPSEPLWTTQFPQNEVGEKHREPRLATDTQ